MNKDDYKNRLRIVLAEKGISNHWLTQQLGVTDMSVRDGAQIRTNRLWHSLSEYPRFSMLT